MASRSQFTRQLGSSAAIAAHFGAKMVDRFLFDGALS
jgi:hypothetical protein